jgi:fructosamine-3-kinase
LIGSRLREALEREVGGRFVRAEPLSGGDINAAYAVELDGVGRIFVKTREGAAPSMFAAEADGLEWLREAGALRVPKVLAFSEPGHSPPFLALEYLEAGRPSGEFDAVLGQGLARVHRSGAPRFGLGRDNFIGSLPQDNTPAPSWDEFYRARRLEPQLRRAVESGQASYALRRGFERLFARLHDLVGPGEPPSRLHGDLWGGNLHVGPAGEPCLIDPAVYGGHREVDLAMMRLFGGFSERVFTTYAEAFPLAVGASGRVQLYQLYPLMVHLNLFGGSYGASVERALARYV